MLVSAEPSLSKAKANTIERPFHKDSIWNRPIETDPKLDPDSDKMIKQLTTVTHNIVNIDGINGLWSVPVYYAKAGTPLQRVCDADGNAPCADVPIPAGVRASPDSDGKAVIIDLAADPPRAWSFWRLAPNSRGLWTVDRGAFGWANISDNGDGLTHYDGGRWGGRVSGWNYYAGLIQPEEIQQGRIDHALLINIPAKTASTEYVWPARASDGSSGNPNAIPIGARLQLDPSIDVETLPLSRGGKIIARALQEYGAWVGDTGSMAALNAREFLTVNKAGRAFLDSRPWSGLLNYRTLYFNFPLNRMRVLQVNRSDFYQEEP
jgi:hypothetical protein